MKYLPLIWSALWRKPARTVLTMLAIMANFLLFGLLQGVNFGFAAVIADQHLDILLTDPRAVDGAPMPGAAQAQIEKLPGVTSVAKRSMFYGYFREQKNGFAALATEPKRWFAVRPEFEIAPEILEALMRTRDGLVVTPTLLHEYGWKIGDRIPIQSTIERRDGEPAWSFELLGSFDYMKNPGKQWLGLINYDYFDEERVMDRGSVDRFIVRISDPARSAQTGAKIDALFANSSHETLTQSEKEQAQSSIKQVGDIAFFANAIVAAVFFTLLLVTANAMAQSVRERTPELAVLKTIGFSDNSVLWLVLAEASTLCLGAALLGLAAAVALFPWAAEMYGLGQLPVKVLLLGVLAAFAVALVSAALPAWQTRRLSIIEALSQS